ncbi:MAG: DNA mismatch repair protein MutS [Saprospirales bacterium]|nr:MAG: DNA mismatch repair protein MutS [Saprospirales bacterium]
MQQYFKMKSKYPDAILLFRVGDFYETFGEDAITTSKILGIILTNRNNGGSKIELAGFPYHSMETYLPKLVKAGYRVAVCDQLEKPSPNKKIVKRGVTEVVTPGVTINDSLLHQNNNNYLCAIHMEKEYRTGMAFLDISTGEFFVTEGDKSQTEKYLQSFQPSEILHSKALSNEIENWLGDEYYTYGLDEWMFTEEFALEKLLQHFRVVSLKGFGIEGLKAAQISAGIILQYLAQTENNKISHIRKISRLQSNDYLWLDKFTIRNLELINSLHPTGHSLHSIIDRTISPMGARLLKKWIVLPLTSINAIQNRLDAVEYLFKNGEARTVLRSSLKKMGDLERLVSKITLQRINPRELLQLMTALEAIGPIIEELNQSSPNQLLNIAKRLDNCPDLQETLKQQIKEDAPAVFGKGPVINDGFNEDLDEWRNTIRNSKELLLEIQTSEIERTGIQNLKIGFNNVFGYYLEVTNKYKNKGLVPDDWVRKQTLSNSERYITEELKSLETRILTAEDQISDIEEKLYAELLEKLLNYVESIQNNAVLLGQLDCLISFAQVAIDNHYSKPLLNSGDELNITNGRHPVIEKEMPPGQAYIPNNLTMDKEENQILMITGPNMSGKSAILRQTALISLMAQMGSFVPAEKAELGLIDKIFTRVGASDNISSGESTFMVEMNETASILNNLSSKSLILLDEIGRGTSTYDGMSIAWSIAEFLHDHKDLRPKTLFATHYHELNELELSFGRIKNFHVATREAGNKVIFLRKLIKGGSNHSFGIHVASMAGMPNRVISRASEILSELEQKSIESGKKKSPTTKPPTKIGISETDAVQLSLFDLSDPKSQQVADELKKTDVNSMTPVECMLKIRELQEILKS